MYAQVPTWYNHFAVMGTQKDSSFIRQKGIIRRNVWEYGWGVPCWRGDRKKAQLSREEIPEEVCSEKGLDGLGTHNVF